MELTPRYLSTPEGAYCSDDCPKEVAQMRDKLAKETTIFSTLLSQLDLISPKYIVNSSAEVTASDVAVVSASNRNHFSEAQKLCITLLTYKGFYQSLPPKFILYNLGDLSRPLIDEYKEECPIVEIRDVHFDAYPVYVRNLFEFRWKSMVIAEVLKEYKVVFYADSSVTFYNKGNATFERYLEKMKRDNIPVALSSWSSHAIVGGTDPNMYEYLPLPEHNLDAGVYAGCHKHDQSAINIVLNLYTKNTPDRYVIERRQWFVEQGQEMMDPQFLAEMTQWYEP
ncbi:unnamed protein product [Toxocara canis]|nr:unnamed protein product [Toxocara canis]